MLDFASQSQTLSLYSLFAQLNTIGHPMKIQELKASEGTLAQMNAIIKLLQVTVNIKIIHV
jgi:hypothetical protein